MHIWVFGFVAYSYTCTYTVDSVDADSVPSTCVLVFDVVNGLVK